MEKMTMRSIQLIFFTLLILSFSDGQVTEKLNDEMETERDGVERNLQRITTEYPDDQAIRQLYTGLGVSPNDMSGDSYCDWKGIQCTTQRPSLWVKREYVQHIFLSRLFDESLDLKGTISTHIGQLSELESLNLYGNSIEGSLPDHIGLLTNVRSVVLSNNKITGEIPPQIGMMERLTSLDLDGNLLSGKIPSQIGFLGRLRELELCCNNLTGGIPWQISNLEDLQVLFLYNNLLEGTLTSRMDQMSKLVWLGVGSNPELSGNPKFLCGLRDFTYHNTQIPRDLCDDFQRFNPFNN